MQNKYVGDIGDYVKLSILRALSPGYRLGVAWFLADDEHSKNDGRHIGYLENSDKWRRFDAASFDGLLEIVRRNDRSVAAIERSGLLPADCIFASEIIPLPANLAKRSEERKRWISEIGVKLNDANLLFLDPDNGLEPDRFRPKSKASIKSVSLDDLDRLNKRERILIVYHHHTRRKGGHFAEIEYQADRLRKRGYEYVDVIRAKPYSPRAFFILNGNDDIRSRAVALVSNWGEHMSWHPNVPRA